MLQFLLENILGKSISVFGTLTYNPELFFIDEDNIGVYIPGVTIFKVLQYFVHIIEITNRFCNQATMLNVYCFSKNRLCSEYLNRIIPGIKDFVSHFTSLVCRVSILIQCCNIIVEYYHFVRIYALRNIVNIQRRLLLFRTFTLSSQSDCRTCTRIGHKSLD